MFLCSDWSMFLCSDQVEPNTKLFPAVFVRPTSPNLFQFELAKIKVPTH